jgi:hypothetical protein
MTRSPRTSNIIHRDRPCDGNLRRPLDASVRLQMHGKVRPMEEPSWFARLLGWR